MPTKNRAKQKEYRDRYRTLHRDRHLDSMRRSAQKHRDSRLAYNAANRELFRKSYRKWRLANLEKDRAYKAVQYAVKTRRLVKPTKCSKCGNIGRTQAHHLNGYSKPHRLDVVWLCQGCHKLLHRTG